MPKAYCGVVDDFAITYRDGHPISTVAALNAHLVTSVLFGDPLLINDGHVLLNPAIRAAVMNPRTSPLRALVQCGYVQILTRNDGQLGTLAEEMREQNVAMTQDVLNDPSFERSYRPRLAQWSDELAAWPSFQPWPSYRVELVFGAVAERALEQMRHDEELDQDALRRFEDALGASISSRSGWERTAKKLFAADDPTFLALMRAACEVHHYSWGCILSDAEGSVRLQTRTAKYLRSLDLEVGEATSESRAAVNVSVPAATQHFVENAVGHHWDRLTEVAKGGTGLSTHKHDFLDTLTKYHTSDDVRQREIDEAAASYSNELAKLFSHSGQIKLALDFSFAATAIGGIAMGLTGPLGIAVGVGSAGAAFAGASFDLPSHFLWRLGAARPARWTKGVRRARPDDTVSSFEIDPVEAEKLLKKDAYTPKRRSVLPPEPSTNS